MDNNNNNNSNTDSNTDNNNNNNNNSNNNSNNTNNNNNNNNSNNTNSNNNNNSNNTDVDGKKAKQREAARLRKQKSRGNQKQKGEYDVKNNLPKREKRAFMKSHEPEKYEATLADRRENRPKKSTQELANDKKRYNDKSQEEKDKRNKQRSEQARSKVEKLKKVLQLSKEDVKKYLPSIITCIVEGFKTTEAFQENTALKVDHTCEDIKKYCESVGDTGDFGLENKGNTPTTLIPLHDFSDIPFPPEWKIHITNEEAELSAALKQCRYNVFIKLHNPVDDPKVVAALVTCPAILFREQENFSRRRSNSFIKYSLTGLKVVIVDFLSRLPKPQTTGKGYCIELMTKSFEILGADYLFLLSNEAREYYINKLGFQPIGDAIKIKIPATYLEDEDIKHSFLYKKLKDDCQDLCDDYIILFDKSLVIA